MELSRRQPSKACKRAEARNRQQFQNKQTSKEKSRGPQNPSRETLGGGGGILPVAISGRYLPGGGGYPIYGLHSDLAKSSLEMIAMVSTSFYGSSPLRLHKEMLLKKKLFPIKTI